MIRRIRLFFVIPLTLFNFVVSPTTLTVEEIAGLLRFTPETVRRYFQRRILHAHALGSDGRSYLSRKESVEVRTAALTHLRPHCGSLEKLGNAFSDVSGRDDRFILDRVDKGEDGKAIAEAFVERVRSKLGI